MPKVSVYFVTDSVRKLLDTLSYVVVKVHAKWYDIYHFPFEMCLTLYA
jgi:hypothetical protein